MNATWQRLLADAVDRPDKLPCRLNRADASIQAVAERFPMLVNPYVLDLIRNWSDALGRQFLPDPEELNDCRRPEDPLTETAQSPVPGLIHRYPGRVAFLVSRRCAVHCRFCMRKRTVFNGSEISSAQIEAGLDYIRGHSQINEVILTGGDPLMLSDRRLASLLTDLYGVGHVRVVRIHTRMPSVLPQRITPELVHILKAFRPLYLNIHFNHPAEISDAVQSACRQLAGAGISLGSQTVLLKGINDQPDVMAELMQKLLWIGIRPYYLHQIDRVPGTAHFQVPIQKALDLISHLRGRISGMAVPHLMIDLPGGGGKIALTPDAVFKREKHQWLFRNWQAKVFAYPEPD